MLGVPRHPKKAVASQIRAEVQGAIIDGEEGIAFPKPEKVLRYACLPRICWNPPLALRNKLKSLVVD